MGPPAVVVAEGRNVRLRHGGVNGGLRHRGTATTSCCVTGLIELP